ncbi:MAG: hypothetical protein BMS9Abin26_2020 [Gammaproteobacteria bacterium]|nr:MAG: hypothetical protein BMS9Abin26_2020 [Gammaproteobacteria bacterium]
MPINMTVTARILPFILYMLFLVLESGLADSSWLADWDLRWLYPAKVAVVSMALILLWSQYTELTESEPMKMGQLGLGVLVGALVFIAWINLDMSWVTMELLGADTPEGFEPIRANGEIDILLAAFRFAGAALVVPVMEELFWRSFVLRWIDKAAFLEVKPAAISLRAFIITALLFGLEHHLWLAGIVAGIAYAWLYIRTNNLWIPVIAHGVTNAMLGIWVLTTGNWQFW